MEVKAEHRGKLKYRAERTPEPPQEDSAMTDAQESRGGASLTTVTFQREAEHPADRPKKPEFRGHADRQVYLGILELAIPLIHNAIETVIATWASKSYCARSHKLLLRATWKVVPLSGKASTHTLPPCRSAIFVTMASPKPVPATPFDFSPRWNIPKIF